MNKKTENIMLLGWVTSLIAMLGSLYFSQIKQFVPCTLCWYQRIMMYPIVLILLIGIIRKDKNSAIYSLVFAGIGLCMSVYHYSLQKVSFLQDVAPSCGQVPCTGQYINWFGFVTIPFLAGTAFIIIIICNVIVLRSRKG
ncbi:disulfide oxidoreductase [Alkalihalobacillus sp. 1P02AB]|uniref:disulfide oxidoreductase n=1 Tax=Alkalihalobacillus sp. 1P02AB TaxID=3132260 RepID=UPI0039A4440D